MLNPFIIKRLLILIIVSYMFFFLGNSMVALTDPDETFYSLTAKEMEAHHEWLVPYIFDKPQFEKPIFTYWLLRAAFDWWGVSPFSARFFPALFGLIGILGVYALGVIGFRDEQKSFWSALILASSGLYIGMSKTVFTDLFFSVFILLSLLSFYAAYANPKRKESGMLSFYIFGALAVLTKGPLGLLIPELIVILFLLYRGHLSFLRTPLVIIGLLLSIAVCVPWYSYMYAHFGGDFIKEFFYNDHWRRLIEAEHVKNDRWYFYPLTMVLGVFPWCLFLLCALWDIYKRLKHGITSFEYFLLSWVIVVLIVFQVAHSKLASYILPMFPALAFLIGNYIHNAISRSQLKAIKIMLWVKVSFLLLLGGAVIVAYPSYSAYVSSKTPIFFLSSVLIVLAGFIATFILKEKIWHALGVTSLILLSVFVTAMIMKRDIEPYVSSFEASQYIPETINTKILTSKANARGMRFYTGKDIAVLELGGGNYFSPHPLEMLSTQANLETFLNKQGRTFAIVKRRGLRAINDLPKENFKVDTLTKSGEYYVIKIDALRNSHT